MPLTPLDTVSSVRVTSFPTAPENEIIRENLVTHIKESFSANKKVILIEDSQFVGKTVLLSQFTRSLPDRCIAFFIGDDFWSSNLHRFLSEMCEQMKYMCKDGNSKKINEIDFSARSENELKQLFNSMYSTLIRQARSGLGPYYFVIDGLDKVQEDSFDSILKFIPSGSPEGVFVLLSSRKALQLNFAHASMTIPKFSLPEVEKYLGAVLKEAQIMNIFKICGGLPGYLQEVRRQIIKGKSAEELASNPPDEFLELLEREWTNFDSNNNFLLKVLSSILFSPTAFTMRGICSFLDKDEVAMTEILSQIPFVEYDHKKDKIELLHAYKAFLLKKLEVFKTQVNQDLITYFEENPTGENLFVFLPELYLENGKFDALSQIINEDSLLRMVGEQGQVSIVRKNLKIFAEMAFKSGDWQKLSWATLTQSVFTSIITHPPAIEEEINALLSLGRFDEAITLSLKCVLPEDRLKLLSTICNQMKEKNHEITDDLIKVLEDSVNLVDNTLELNETVIEKLLDISAEIFPFHANLALRLVKRIAEEKGESQNDKLMDLLIMRLLLKTKVDPNSIDEIKNQLGLDSLHEFTKAASIAIASNSIESILQQVKDITDTSAKLFLLQTWCNVNHDHPNCHEVIRHAAEIMTESSNYTPTHVHMRKFIEPLQSSDQQNIKKELVGKFDILKETVIKNPIEEYARLELTLAEIEKEWSEDDAIKRLYALIFFMEEIEELDTRCQVLIRILLSLSKLVPSDIDLKNELNNQFYTTYNQLLRTSADHYTISKRILPSLTIYDCNLAESFVSKMNTVQRRNLAYAQLLRVYVKNLKESIDLKFILSTLQKITYDHFRDWVLVQVIKSISKHSKTLDKQKKYQLKDMVYAIKSSIGKSYALAYYILWMGEEDPKLSEALFSNLKENLIKIDSPEQRSITGFRTSSIISLHSIDWAEVIFLLTKEYKNGISFSETRIKELYIKTCNLLINTIPEIKKTQDFKEKIAKITGYIEIVPSLLDKVGLYNSLAIKCYVSNGYSEFRMLAEQCLKLVDNSLDLEIYNTCLAQISPTLFLFERKILFEKIEHLPKELMNDALYQTAKVILSKRLPDENVDLDTLRTKIDYRDVIQVCDILELMTEDMLISSIISCLIDLLIEPAPNNKVRGTLPEKQLLSIAERLTKICSEKLPDKDNIEHDGYLIIAQSDISKLKYASPHNRALGRWDTLAPDWNVLKTKAMAIQNDSDKTYVLGNLATRSFVVDQESSKILALTAEKTLPNISNNIDRIERYQFVAKALNQTSNNHAAKDLLVKAMDLVRYYSYEERDQMMGRLIEVAHNVEPELATTLASKADNAFELSQLKDNIRAMTLHSEPQKILNYSANECKSILGNVFEKVLRSLRSNRGTAQHDSVIGSYLLKSLGQDYETVNLAVHWFIENTIYGNQSQSRISKLDELFDGIANLLEMIKRLGDFLMENESAVANTEDSIYRILAPSNTHTFGTKDGEKERALKFICTWLAENGDEYVKIYEPYFTEEYLEILKSISVNCRINIMASMKKVDVESMNIEDVYKRNWHRICDQSPPETHVMIYYTQNGKTSMHDRYIITESGGLSLGTSLDGFESKDSTIKILDLSEKIKIEAEIINPLLLMPPRTYENQRVYLKTFTLDM